MPKTVKCAHLQANKTTWSTVSSGIFGNNQCSSGPMMLQERRAEFSSLDAAKIRPNQSRITSQYFRNTRSLDTAHSKQVRCNEAIQNGSESPQTFTQRTQRAATEASPSPPAMEERAGKRRRVFLRSPL